MNPVLFLLTSHVPIVILFLERRVPLSLTLSLFANWRDQAISLGMCLIQCTYCTYYLMYSVTIVLTSHVSIVVLFLSWEFLSLPLCTYLTVSFFAPWRFSYRSDNVLDTMYLLQQYPVPIVLTIRIEVIILRWNVSLFLFLFFSLSTTNYVPHL